MPAKRTFVPDDLWLLRSVSDPQVSADGSLVAFVIGTPDRETDKPATAIWVAQADGSSPARQFTAGPKDSAPRWSPDGQWLAFISDRGDGTQLYRASLGGGEPLAVTNLPQGVLQPAWSPDGTRLAFIAKTGEWKKPEDRTAIERSAPRVVSGLYSRFDGIGWFDGRRSHVFVVAAEGGDPEQITEGDWDDGDPAWSPDGREIAFVSDRSETRFDAVHRDVWVAGVAGRHHPRLLTRGRGTASSPQWSPDGRTIAYVGHENAEGDSAKHTHLMVVPASGSSGRRAAPPAPRSLNARLDRSVWGLASPFGSSFAWTANGKAVLYAVSDAGTLAVYRSPVRGRVSPEPVARGDRQVVALHAAGDTLAFVSVWPSNPPELYVAHIDGSRERRLSEANAELRRLRVAAVRRVRHRAGDGKRIDSFVMYPPGYTKGKKAPLVLDIHGGPHGWHPQAALLPLYQALAAAGYVVVLPNPRGSHGYGQEFAEACVGDWGGADFEDLMGAVDALVASGVADPKRLYVTGYSYGGFMTAWAVGHTDRFSAACVAAPITDQTSMWGTTDVPGFLTHEIGGVPWEEPERYAERSPLSYVSNVRTPVQLFHWEGDLRCPIVQTEQFFHTLRKLSQEVVMVRYPGGFHIVRSPSQMVDYLERHLAWFGKHRGR